MDQNLASFKQRMLAHWLSLKSEIYCLPFLWINNLDIECKLFDDSGNGDLLTCYSINGNIAVKFTFFLILYQRGIIDPPFITLVSETLCVDQGD